MSEKISSKTFIFTLVVNRRGRQRREQRELRLGVFETRCVNKKMNSVPQVVSRLLRKSSNQRDGYLDAIPIGGFNALPNASARSSFLLITFCSLSEPVSIP